MRKLSQWRLNRKGQGAVEYALITLVIVLILIAFVGSTDNPIRDMIADTFGNVQDKIGTEITGA